MDNFQFAVCIVVVILTIVGAYMATRPQTSGFMNFMDAWANRFHKPSLTKSMYGPPPAPAPVFNPGSGW